MREMTLREICDAAAVSRRAVQGYEKAGLVAASAKNEYGHLLYDVDAQRKIRQIKLFQQLGFTIKEIKNIIDAPDDILKSALESRVKQLKEEHETMKQLIAKAYEMINQL